jgi:asparagine N-glycosylation enzyme membrane subunit Stt3
MQKQSLSILEKIMYPLGGFLIGTLLITTGLKITGDIKGIIGGMIVTGAGAWYLTKKFPGKKDKKFISYGLYSSIILVSTLGLLAWIIANILMAGISG